ncbi:MAG: secretin and TonB N-terminal domain-containing protein [Prevotella sp.]|nr:secretin and TonB N-terminal domain-containing protein [Prevotella sp.]
MRIAVILLFGIIFHAGASNIYSQTASVSLNLKNTTVEKVLNTIEENSEFYFLYNSKLVDVDRKVNIDVKNQSIESVLKSLFGSTDVYYKVEGKQIILSNKTISSLDTQKTLQQNIKKITGVVREVNKEPVVGEGFRWNDIVRWKAGKLIENMKTVYGLRVTDELKNKYESFTRELTDDKLLIAYPNVAPRKWNDKLYLRPLPIEELAINTNLTQNPGWE